MAAAVHPTTAVIQGILGNKEVNMMMDSGSSISLIEQSVAASFPTEASRTESSVRLVSAAGDSIPTLGSITLSVCLGPLRTNHSLVIVHSLISPVILGLDFLCKHRITVDFSSSPITLVFPQTSDQNLQDFIPIFDSSKKNKAKICAVEALNEPTEDSIDECAVPLFTESCCNQYDVPSCTVPILSSLLEKYKGLFQTLPGSTNLAEHFI